MNVLVLFIYVNNDQNDAHRMCRRFRVFTTSTPTIFCKIYNLVGRPVDELRPLTDRIILVFDVRRVLSTGVHIFCAITCFPAVDRNITLSKIFEIVLSVSGRSGPFVETTTTTTTFGTVPSPTPSAFV
ncbi:Hypothetical protein CINCED_3A022156 [Cinara cedri]|uniref:Uncharacterized protein n=1 Tax=Cinara cedri TaxID=506608 RepID=A0A5E4N275_9HEMI|nr:Hypothetical protein CINCED_3A022156 [Cinara cedri]